MHDFVLQINATLSETFRQNSAAAFALNNTFRVFFEILQIQNLIH